MSKLGALFVSELSEWNKLWDIKVNYDNSPSKMILGIEYSKSREAMIAETG